ncbi:MAG: serine hydrolase [Oscillospiraceae bacterium]|nr:serine hydrolase [Oscillospiraceae bacterium]
MELKRQMRALDYFKNLIFSNENPPPFLTSLEKKPACVPTVSTQPLPRSTPEQQGINSSLLTDFYTQLCQNSVGNPHSCMVLRHGTVISEGYWKPYRADYYHVTHSLCKSLTGMAIGLLIEDGLLLETDKIADIFSDKITLLTSRNMRSVTVEHLLTMTSGAKFNEGHSVIDNDWVKSYFNADTAGVPGTKFNYNSLNTYMLSAIVQRKTGKTLHAFLTERLFFPMGIENTWWEKCPMGICKGGWGFYLKTEDMAKLGLLYMQKGMWQGRQLINSAWVEKATVLHSKGEKEDECGYGYQLWIMEEPKGYIYNGLFGQYVVCMPQQDIVLVITAGSENLFINSAVFSIFTKTFHADFSNQPLPRNYLAYKSLTQLCSQLTYGKALLPSSPSLIQKLQHFFSKPKADATYNTCKALHNRTYYFDGRAGILPLIAQAMMGCYAGFAEKINFSFDPEGKGLCMNLTEAGILHEILIGFEPQPAYSLLHFACGDYTVGTRGLFTHDEDGHLVLKLWISFIELTSTRTLKLFFIDDETLVVKYGEEPSVETAILKLREVDGLMDLPLPGELFSITENEYIDYRFNKLVAPVLTGKTKKEA